MFHLTEERVRVQPRFAALLAVAVLTGCRATVGSTEPGSPEGRCTEECVDIHYAGASLSVLPPPSPDTVEASAEVFSVSILVRSFLLAGEREGAGYVFHNYLFLADHDADTRPIRLAAAVAVLDLFDRVVGAAVFGVDTTRLAVLHVPVCSPDVAAWVLAGGGRRPTTPACARLEGAPPASGAERLLAGYDHEGMQGIKQRVEAASGRSLPRLALLGHPTPLGGDGAIDLERLYIIDLDVQPPDEVGQMISRFKNALESRRGLHGQFPDVAEQNLDAYVTLGIALREYTGRR